MLCFLESADTHAKSLLPQLQNMHPGKPVQYPLAPVANSPNHLLLWACISRVGVTFETLRINDCAQLVHAFL
jgi:hypothetical protein